MESPRSTAGGRGLLLASADQRRWLQPGYESRRGPGNASVPESARFSELAEVTFTDLAEGDELLLLTAAGDIVRRWTNASGDDIVWDGTNESGHQVASGTYLWYTSESASKGKLLVVR